MRRQNIRRALVVISFLLFPITIYYLSPILIIQGLAEGIIAGSFIFFALLFLVSLFMGRAYCGWVCPAGGLQDICTLAAGKKAKGGKGDWIKFFIWVPWMISIIVLFISSGPAKNIDGFYQTFHGISIAEPAAYIIYYLVIALIVIISFTGGKRAFCHYVCWMAPFMIIGAQISTLLRLPSLRLTAGKSKCINCKVCDKNCVMSLPVSEMVQKSSMKNPECILCGGCVDNCHKGAIKYCFSKNG